MKTVILYIKRTLILASFVYCQYPLLQAKAPTNKTIIFQIMIEERQANPQLTQKILTNLVNCLSTLPKISGNELSQLFNIIDPLKKFIVASLHAINEHIVTVKKNNPSLKEYEKTLSEMTSYINQAITALSSTKPNKKTAATTPPATINDLHKLMVQEIQPLIDVIKKDLSSKTDNIEKNLQNWQNIITMFSINFEQFFKASLVKQLSKQDIGHIVAFFKSSVYQKLKENIDKIFQAVKEAFSTNVQGKIDSALHESAQTLPHMAGLLSQKAS